MKRFMFWAILAAFIIIGKEVDGRYFGSATLLAIVALLAGVIRGRAAMVTYVKDQRDSMVALLKKARQSGIYDAGLAYVRTAADDPDDMSPRDERFVTELNELARE